jgi:hypothetical protein
MFVRYLTGRRKGEVEEMKFLDARALLDDGRAERAYREEIAKPAAQEEAQRPKKGKRK